MGIGIDLTTSRGYQGTEVYADNLVSALLRRVPAVSSRGNPNASEDPRLNDLVGQASTRMPARGGSASGGHSVGMTPGENKFIIFLPKGLFSQIEQIAREKENMVLHFFKPTNNTFLIVFRQQVIMPLLCLRYRIRILYSSSPFFSWLAPTRKIVTIHDCAYARFPEFRSVLSSWYIRISLFLSRFLYHKIATVSEFSKRELAGIYGFSPRNIAVVPNALPSLPKVTVDEAEAVKATLGLADPYFIYVGITRPRKNIERLLKAFAVFNRKHPEYRLVLAGKVDASFINISETAEALGISGRVLQTGFVSDEQKTALYSGSRGLVFPSLYEGFGLPVLEAQSLGVPVLTSATSSLPEVAGNAALLVNPERVEEIAAGMEKLAFDEPFRKDIIEKGHENVRLYSWIDSAEKLRRILVNDREVELT